MQKNNSISFKNGFRRALNYRKPIQQINEFKNRPSDSGGNANHWQLVNHSFSTLPLGIGDTLVIFKTDQWVPKYILFLAKLKRVMVLFWRGQCRMQQEITTKSNWLLLETRKDSPFKKVEKIPHLLCFLLEPLKNQYRRLWNSMIDCVGRSQGVLKESSCNQV